MAQLPQYTAQVGGVPIGGGRRADAADDPTAAVLHAGAAQVGKAGEAIIANIEEDESRKALIDVSQIRTKYAASLDDANNTIKDPEALKVQLATLKQQLADDMAKVGEGFQTKKGNEALRMYSANTNLMFDEQVNRIAVQSAASQAKVQGQQFLKDASTLIQRDPAYLAIAEKNADEFVDTFPKLPQHIRAEIKDNMKKSLNMAAAIGAVRTDPVEGKKRLEAGEWNLTLEQREHAMKEAEHYAEVKRAADERERVRLDRESLKAALGAWDGYSQRILKGDHGAALYSDIVRDPAFAEHPQMREHLAAFLQSDKQRLAGLERKGDPALYNALWLRATASDDDPTKMLNIQPITAAVALHAAKGEGYGLNTTEAERLMAVVRGQADENGRKLQPKMQVLVSRFQGAIRNDPRMLAFDANDQAAIVNRYSTLIGQEVSKFREANDAKGLRELFDDPKNTIAKSLGQQAIDEVRSEKMAAQPKLTDLRQVKDPIAAALEVPVNMPYIDPKGRTLTMTQATLDALKKQAPKEAPAAREEQRLPHHTLSYIAMREGVSISEINPYTGKRWAEAAPAELYPPAKPLKFDPMRGGLQPMGQ